MNLKHLVGKRMDIILEHKRSRGNYDYQTVTSKIVKSIKATKNTLKIKTVNGSDENFTNVNKVDIKRGLFIVTYNDGSRTFLDFF